MKQQKTNKQYYDVKVEALIPAVLTYRVLAENPEEALSLIKNKVPNSVSYKLIGKRDLIIKIYDAGSSMMRFIKKIINR